ncbi:MULTISPECIES: TlpA disulfide reductase family protein [unclassified Vibrio]|uniref:TlpA disulfide reductase family protein n=1 Tax=Vibrio sp. HB236076 TaxID=3232307 RepID=A0AB39HDA7_9VIBR|nr:TlpA disulfide reductase family protein [Vibrio sp. HB161653]MDP5255522.1 TlpA disulfide reductase family protein [Vibrio sp. HB161653]
MLNVSTWPRRGFLLISLLLSACFSSIAKAEDSVSISGVSFPNLAGESVALTDFKGQVVLLNFWATWCPPCVREMPSMQHLRAQLSSQGFEVVAIAVSENAEMVNAFLPKLDTKLTFPILTDEKGTAFTSLKLRGLPMSYVIDREGVIRHTLVGEKDWQAPENIALIKELL